MAYINDGLALHCVGCPAAAECPNAIASTGTNTTSTAANSGSKGPVAGQGSCSGRKGGRAAAAMSSSGGLTALFGRRVNGTIGSGCADALAYPAAADGDMATANGANGWACTLHLYAPPIRRVKVRCDCRHGHGRCGAAQRGRRGPGPRALGPGVPRTRGVSFVQLENGLSP